VCRRCPFSEYVEIAGLWLYLVTPGEMENFTSAGGGYE